jgi:hypothetical protein
MGAARELVTSTSGYSEANVKLEDIKKALLSQELLQSSHGEVERFLRSEGRELLRLLLQGHLDARGDAPRNTTLRGKAGGGGRSVFARGAEGAGGPRPSGRVGLGAVWVRGGCRKAAAGRDGEVGLGGG